MAQLYISDALYAEYLKAYGSDEVAKQEMQKRVRDGVPNNQDDE